MKQAIIDIGSNSMRLVIYDVWKDSYSIHYKDKIMAGLASYVKKDSLTEEGIEAAYNGLLDFKQILESRKVKEVAVFASASLRGLKNAEKVLKEIKKATGFTVEILSGEEEAYYSYMGAMGDLSLDQGVLIDIGGASTEVVVFREHQLVHAQSFQVGGLSLYKDCVTKILPGKGSLKKINRRLKERIDKKSTFTFPQEAPLICVGGTIRNFFKLAQKVYGLSDERRSMTVEQVKELGELLCEQDKTIVNLVLKISPERIHTLVPGVMILMHIVKRVQPKEIIISDYGLREGYLCHKVLKDRKTTSTHKTEN